MAIGEVFVKARIRCLGLLKVADILINIGTFRIPVDSFQGTSGGSRMFIRISNPYDASTSTTNQRQRNEVYQTPRFSSPDPYRDGQTGVAVSRRLRKNDSDRPVLSDITNLSL